MTDQASIKVDRTLKAELEAMNAPTMNAAISEALHGNHNQIHTLFAAAGGDVVTGLPSVAIPTVDEPTLTMWKTMEKRVIKADHEMRVEAATDDVFRMLGSIIDACAIGMYAFTATDMDQSAETIAEMKTWIRETKLMQAFKGGGINSTDSGALNAYRVQGEYALWIKRSGKTGATGKIEEFINIPVNGIRRMTNPQDPSQYYFYQKYKKVADYKKPEEWDGVESERDVEDIPSEEQKVWYIEGGEKSREEKGEDGELLYPEMGKMDWALPLENLVYVKNPSPPLNDFTVSAIAAKRYLILMSPVAIQLGIVPFDVLTFGNDDLRPPVVDAQLKETNLPEYNKQVKILDAFNASIQTIIHELFDCSINGKPFGVQWGVEHERFEPKMSLTADFIETMLFSLNQIIAFSVGIPLTIITSVGTELATSRLTMATTSHALVATQESFKDVIMHLLRMQFETEIEDQGIEIQLQELDNTDQKTKAEIYALVAQAVQHLSVAGATAETKAQFINSVIDMPITHSEFLEMEESQKTDEPPEEPPEDEPEEDEPEEVDEDADNEEEEVV